MSLRRALEPICTSTSTDTNYRYHLTDTDMKYTDSTSRTFQSVAIPSFHLHRRFVRGSFQTYHSHVTRILHSFTSRVTSNRPRCESLLVRESIIFPSCIIINLNSIRRILTLLHPCSTETLAVCFNQHAKFPGILCEIWSQTRACKGSPFG